MAKATGAIVVEQNLDNHKRHGKPQGAVWIMAAISAALVIIGILYRVA